MEEKAEHPVYWPERGSYVVHSDAPLLPPERPSQAAYRSPSKRPVNHPLHIILSLLTGGLWLFVYLWIVLRNPPRR